MTWLNRELVNMVDLSSALLLPSKIETFGSVAFEAMAEAVLSLCQKMQVSMNGIHSVKISYN